MESPTPQLHGELNRKKEQNTEISDAIRFIDPGNFNRHATIFNDPNFFLFNNLDPDTRKFCAGGGCPSKDEEKLYEHIEDHEVKKRVASGMNKPAARRRAREIVKRRRDVDDSYKERDALGLEGKGPDFELTDTDVVFPRYGSLNEMFGNQRELRPDEFRGEEYETVTRAYQKLRDGAKQVVHISHHYNEKRELVIRDAVLLTYDHATGRGQMYILNISQEGKTHKTLESAYEAVANRLGEGFTRHKSNAVTLFTRSETAVEPLTLFRSTEHVQIFERNVYYADGRGREMWGNNERSAQMDLAIGFPKHTLSNVRYADADTSISSIPFRMPEFLGRLVGIRKERKVPFRKYNAVQRKERNMIPMKVFEQVNKRDVYKKETPARTKKKDRVLGLIYEFQKKPKRTEEKKVKMESKKSTPFLKKSCEPQEHQKVKSSDRRKIFFFKEKGKQVPLRMRERKTLFRRERKRSSPETLFPFFIKLEKIHLRLVGLERRLLKRERGKFSFQKQRRETNQFKTIENKFYIIHERIRYTIFRIAYAHALFRLLDEMHIHRTSSKKETKQEETPWILLSIIWYLAMLREQGKAMYIPKKKKSHKKRTRGKKKQWIKTKNPVFSRRVRNFVHLTRPVVTVFEAL